MLESLPTRQTPPPIRLEPPKGELFTCTEHGKREYHTITFQPNEYILDKVTKSNGKICLITDVGCHIQQSKKELLSLLAY